MARLLSEQDVKKKLGIDDFRHLTKDKVIAMASMMDKMDPEVAKKVIEQFPNFSETIKGILQDYKESLANDLESNNKSVMSYYESCDAVISSLQDMIKDDNLSFEEKEVVIDKLEEIVKMKGNKDTENKKFIIALGGLATLATTIAAGLLANALGGNVKIETKDIDKLIDK